MTDFIPGKELSKRYYEEIVQPLLAARFPQLPYTAGLLDYGSDVLGFDTEISRDHQWGPRFSLFLCAEEHAKHKDDIDEMLKTSLPYEFLGYPTNFSEVVSDGVRCLEKKSKGQVHHLIRIQNQDLFLKEHLGKDGVFDLSLQDWLFFPEQKLCVLKNGSLFHDDLNLQSRLDLLEYYPRDIWLFRMASEWKKISEEEAFVGRCGDVGDEIGSALVAGRIVRSMMQLCFLLERRYAPYAKWFGTAFAQLRIAPKIQTVLTKILHAKHWKDREALLSEAYGILAKMHNDLQITKPMSTSVKGYFGRPYLVLFALDFAEALQQEITEKEIKSLDLIGSIDQLTSTVSVLDNPRQVVKAQTFYL